MAATIQLIVAGVLLLAWIWVLGRPLISGTVERRTYRSIDRFSPDHSRLLALESGSEVSAADASAPGRALARRSSLATRPVVGPLVRWWRSPVEQRRRQFLLATLFATFVSFLLAVAVRDRLLPLFGLMSAFCVLHLLVAIVVGRRIEAARRSRPATDASAVVPGRGVEIRASRVVAERAGRASLTIDPDAELAVASAGSFGTAAAIAADLEGWTSVAEPVGAATSYVSELIDSEWGAEPEHPVAPPPDVDVAVDVAVEPEPEVHVEIEVQAEPKVEFEVEVEAEVEAEVRPEPIFTRAVMDGPTRPRRKAQAIYIESQLDEDDDVTRATAVNHR